MTTKKTLTKKANAGAPNTGPPKRTRVRNTAAARSATTAPLEVTLEERWRMIAVAAYHKAEQRSFTSGREVDDWLEAEKEVDALLGA